METILFLKGLSVGFALAAPVGPVGILCIRRALADGRCAAFIAGLGAACADTFYGAVAGLGLTVVSSFLISHEITLRVLGGLFLIVLGLRTGRSHPVLSDDCDKRPGLARDFISTFLLTLTNPATILASMGVFAALGALDTGNPRAAATMIGGVFAGSALWWLVLSASAASVRNRFSPHWLERINRVSGALLLLFGVAILGSLFFEF